VPAGFNHRPVPKVTRGHARRMRHDPTDAERAMWRLLRGRRLADWKFRRQVPFQTFILDFVCFESKVVIEVDGGQHLSSPRDERRDRLLIEQGFRVLRYWNNDVLLQPDSVLEDIFAKLSDGDC
jgi:very-short-patch-repair endonuclease